MKRFACLVISCWALDAALADPALPQVPSRRRLTEEATAAIVAALPTGAATRLRGLEAFVQQPGNDAVCG